MSRTSEKTKKENDWKVRESEKIDEWLKRKETETDRATVRQRGRPDDSHGALADTPMVLVAHLPAGSRREGLTGFSLLPKVNDRSCSVIIPRSLFAWPGKGDVPWVREPYWTSNHEVLYLSPLAGPKEIERTRTECFISPYYWLQG